MSRPVNFCFVNDFFFLVTIRSRSQQDRLEILSCFQTNRQLIHIKKYNYIIQRWNYNETRRMKKELTVYVNFLPSITKTVDRNFNEDPRNSYLRFELSLSPCSAPSNCRVRFSVSPARSPHFVRRPSRRPSSRATVETILKKQQQQQQQKQTRKAK